MRENDKFTILIVEDEESLRDIYEEWLRSDSRIIHKSCCAEDALKYISSNAPDLILLDLGLPEASGIDFLRSIFKGKPVPDIPVLIISGLEDLTTKLTGFISGAKRYFVKPVEKIDLEKSVELIESRKGDSTYNMFTFSLQTKAVNS